MTNIKYIPELDGLRAIAVITVVLFHVGFSKFSGGFIGVDIFFVISGFLITKLIANEVSATHSFNFANFYLRRARRLLPAFIFILIISTTGAFLLFTPQHFQRFGGELTYSATSLSNLYFWNESGYFNTASEFKPLLHTWSLSVEEQFYLFWPITLVFLLKMNKFVSYLFIITIGLLSLLGNFVIADGHRQLLTHFSPLIASWFSNESSTIFYLTPFRMFEFIIGASLVWLIKYQFKNNWFAEIGLLLGLALIGYSIFSFTEHTLFPSYNALYPCLGAGLIIFSFNAKNIGWIIRNKISVFVGLISYSVYLIHWPLIVFYKYWKITPLTRLDKIELMSLSILIGFLMFRYIETPFRLNHVKKSKKLAGPAFGLACAILLLIIEVPAATIWASDGWYWRIPELPNDIALQVKDSKQFHIDQYGGAGFPEPYHWINNERNNVADIVVIGDSHAAQLKTGIKDFIGDAYKKNIFFDTASCLILPNMFRVTKEQDWRTICSNVFNQALQVIDNSPNAVVVIAESWVTQIPIAASTDNKSPLLVNNDWESALAKVNLALGALKNRIGNRKLVIVGNVPGAGIQDSAGCFLRPKYFNYDCNKLLISSEKNNKNALIVNNAFANFAKLNKNVYFINPYDSLCNKGFCKALNDNKFLYSDGFHLSKEGSRFFIKNSQKELLGLLS